MLGVMPGFAASSAPETSREKPMRIVAILFLLLFMNTAQAYLDPGTGSMLLQVILGGVAAVGVIIKLYWYKILSFLGIKKKQPVESE
jgi:hypothetical protein